MRGCFRRSPRLAEHPDDRASTKAAPIAARFLKGTVRCSPCAVCTFAQTRLPFWRGIAPSKVISMTMTAQEYRANARQCLSWAESASDPENREAFFALAATWESAAATRSPHQFEDKKTEKALLSTFFSGLLEFLRRNSSLFLLKCLLFQTGNPFRRRQIQQHISLISVYS